MFLACDVEELTNSYDKFYNHETINTTNIDTVRYVIIIKLHFTPNDSRRCT